MIPTLIFSKDRACQLDAVLRSICDYMPWAAPTVLWTASNDEFDAGYQMLRKIDYEGISWLSEHHFQHDVIEFLEKSKFISRLCMFLTDDDVVYREPDYSYDDIIELFDQNQVIATLSNRLGKNTLIQSIYNPEDRIVLPTQAKTNDKMIVWSWKHVPTNTNFGYPLSVDGHIFRINQILPLVKKIDFTQPNEFEGRLQTYSYQLPGVMACGVQSCVVGIPVNRVQNVVNNRAGETYGISAMELNQRFLDGERINLNKMDFSNIIGAHQEVELVLE